MRANKRLFKYAGVLSISALALASCGSDNGGGSSSDGDGDAVIHAYSVEPQNPLVPTNTNEVGGGHIIDAIFAGLVSYNSDGSYELEVADSIESDDNKVWTITLKEGWLFSDGSEVTADSFVDAWNYGADPENGQLNAYFFSDIEGTDDEGTSESGDTISGLEVIDDYTFEVTLKEGAADFPTRLGYSAYFPLPEVAFEDMEAFGTAPVSNGPYVLDEYDLKTRASLVTNEDYDGNRNAQNDGIVFEFYTDPDAGYTDIQSGNLDIMDQVPPSAVETFMDDDSVQAVMEPGANFSSFTIPARLDHFGDDEEGQLRRQALSRAIDRETITETIFDGTSIPAVDFSSPQMGDFTENIEGADVLEFDVDEAKDLWAQADEISEWSGTFELAYNSDGAGNAEWVEAVTNQIRDNLEIDAEPRPYPTFAELRELVTDRSIDASFRTGWQADYPSVANYLGPLYATGAGSNDGDYSNPDFDAKIREANAAEDDAERAEALAEAQAILMEDLPAIPLWNRSAIAVAANGVEGVELNWQDQPQYHLITK